MGLGCSLTKVEALPEHGKFLAFLSLKSLEVDDVDLFLSSLREAAEPALVQAFDARMVAGRRHLWFAALLALNAFRDGTNISESLPMELLLQASAQRQIDRALEMLGVKRGRGSVAIVLMADSEEAVLEAWGRVGALYPEAVGEDALVLTDDKVEGLMEVFGVDRKSVV